MVLLALGARSWWGVPDWAAALAVALWVAKDVALYPFVRIAYESGRGRGGAYDLVGAWGTAQDELRPTGYVRVASELWRAELAPGATPVARGARVHVRGVHGLTLVVEPAPEASDRGGAARGAGLVLLVAGALALAACPPSTVPHRPRPGEEARGVPIYRAKHPVAGRVTYRLVEVGRRGEHALVDLDLTNGTGRDFTSVALTVRLEGPEGEALEAWVPVGILRASETRHVAADVPGVGFGVEQVRVRLHVTP